MRKGRKVITVTTMKLATAPVRHVPQPTAERARSVVQPPTLQVLNVRGGWEADTQQRCWALVHVWTAPRMQEEK